MSIEQFLHIGTLNGASLHTFAGMMAERIAHATPGRSGSGWLEPSKVSQLTIAARMNKALLDGDMVSVANFAMALHMRGEAEYFAGMFGEWTRQGAPSAPPKAVADSVEIAALKDRIDHLGRRSESHGNALEKQAMAIDGHTKRLNTHRDRIANMRGSIDALNKVVAESPPVAQATGLHVPVSDGLKEFLKNWTGLDCGINAQRARMDLAQGESVSRMFRVGSGRVRVSPETLFTQEAVYERFRKLAPGQTAEADEDGGQTFVFVELHPDNVKAPMPSAVDEKPVVRGKPYALLYATSRNLHDYMRRAGAATTAEDERKHLDSVRESALALIKAIS